MTCSSTSPGWHLNHDAIAEYNASIERFNAEARRKHAAGEPLSVRERARIDLDEWSRSVCDKLDERLVRELTKTPRR